MELTIKVSSSSGCFAITISPFLIKVLFVSGDCGKNLRDDAIIKDEDKEVYNCINGRPYSKKSNILNDFNGICNEGANVVSCQFAIHYFRRLHLP